MQLLCEVWAVIIFIYDSRAPVEHLFSFEVVIYYRET